MPLFIKKLIASISKRFGNYPVSVIQDEYTNVVLQKRSTLNTRDSGSLIKKEADFLDQMIVKADIYFPYYAGTFGFVNKTQILSTVQILNSDNQSFFELTREMDSKSTRYWKFRDSCQSMKFEIHRNFKDLIERKYDR